jgi:hypothetical protein
MHPGQKDAEDADLKNYALKLRKEEEYKPSLLNRHL